MPDLAEQIRVFIDSGATPVTAEEVVSGIARSHEQVPTTGHSRSSSRVAIYGSVVAVAALVLAVVGVSLNSSGVHTEAPPASAASFLGQVASIAARQKPLVPAPGQYLYTRRIDGEVQGAVLSNARFYFQAAWEQWSSPDGLGRSSYSVVGQPLFVTSADRSLWEQSGSPSIETGYSGGGVPPYYDVTNLPTKASQIKSYFDNQPSSVLPATPTYGKNAVWQFDAASEFLQHGASSKQRAALLRFMATIPGVRYLGKTTTFGNRQKGTLLSIPTIKPAGDALQAVFNPKTSALLETRIVVVDPSKAPVRQIRTVSPVAKGQVQSYADLVDVGVTNSTDSPPTGAPALPSLWPYGTAREPVPGSAYP
jgi:hypothetical protein